jgi:hypothetical protein
MNELQLTVGLSPPRFAGRDHRADVRRWLTSLTRYRAHIHDTIPEPRTVSFQGADDLGLLVVMAQGRRAFYNLHHVESFSPAQV